MPDRGRHRLLRLALALLAVSAIWCVAIAYEMRVVWLLVLPVALSLITGVREVPLRITAFVIRAGNGVVALTILYGFLWTSSLVYEGPITSLGPLTAVGALLLGVIALLGTRVWSLASAALPVLLAAILSASFVPSKPLTAPIIAAGFALFFYGALTLQPLIHRAHQTRAIIGQILFVLAVTGFALGAAFLLPRAQPVVENLVIARLSPGASTGFGVDGRLGAIESLSRSSRPVARVFTDRPQRLRLYVATYFNGHSWSNELRTTLPLRAIRVAPVAWRSENEWLAGQWYGLSERVPDQNWTATRVISARTFDDRHLTPAGLWFVRSPGDSLRLDGGGVLRGSPMTVFGTLSGAMRMPLVEERIGVYLSIPHDVDPRVLELGFLLAEKDETTAARVANTLRFLERQCRYSLDVGKFRTADPLSEFLFEKRVGYCEYFATAAAILLRLQAVPTRYVRGFAVSEWDRRGGHFIVRESNAHAWIDVWDAENGWTEVDPTPPDQYADVHAEHVSWPRLAWDRLTGEWVVLSARLRGGGAAARMRLIIKALGIVGLPILIILLARRTSLRRPPRATIAVFRSRAEIERLIALFDRKLRKSGWPRPPSRAPLEHLNALPLDAVALEWRESARQAFHHIYAEIYGGRFISPDMIEDLIRRLASPGHRTRS